MENVDLSKYGIVGNFEIVHNPSYEQLFQDEMNPANEGFEKGYLTDTGAVAVNTVHRTVTQRQIYCERCYYRKYCLVGRGNKQACFYRNME